MPLRHFTFSPESVHWALQAAHSTFDGNRLSRHSTRRESWNVSLRRKRQGASAVPAQALQLPKVKPAQEHRVFTSPLSVHWKWWWEHLGGASPLGLNCSGMFTGHLLQASTAPVHRDAEVMERPTPQQHNTVWIPTSGSEGNYREYIPAI